MTASSSTVEHSGTSSYFSPRRLTHFNLEAEFLDKNTSFYRDIVGFGIAYERPLIQSKFFSNGHTYHDLALMDAHGEMGSGGHSRLHHLAFELENEVELVQGYEAAIASGIEFEFTASHDVAHSVYLRDPDGHGVEIYADVIREWWNVSSGVVTKQKDKWYPGLTEPVAQSCYPVDPEITSVADAVFAPKRTACATIVTGRFAEMLDFYTSTVGLNALAGDQSSPYALLGGALGEPDLALFRSTESRRPGLHHVSVELQSAAAFDTGMTRLTGSDVDPALLIECAGRRAVYLRDPDGLYVQLYVDSTELSILERLSSIDDDLALFVL
jgi:catechol 2,3-dioxygenase